MSSSVTVNSCGPCGNIKINTGCNKVSDCFACNFKKCEKKTYFICRDSAIERFNHLIKSYQHKIKIEQSKRNRGGKINRNYIKYYRCLINDLQTRKAVCQTKGKNEKCGFTKSEAGCGGNDCCQEQERQFLLFFQNGRGRGISKYGNTTKQGRYRICG